MVTEKNTGAVAPSLDDDAPGGMDTDALRTFLDREMAAYALFFRVAESGGLLAVQSPEGPVSPAVREELIRMAESACPPCETPPVIEIMEGENSDSATSQTERLRIEEALETLLPRYGVPTPEDGSGWWLILTWRVPN